MAIPFLNNITLNNNEIQNVRLHNTGTSNNAKGQIFFNTGVDLAQYYANAIDQWVSLKEYSFGDGTYISANVTGTAAKPIITPDLSATAVTGNIDATKYLRGDNKWAEISTIPGTYSWEFDGDSGPTQTVLSTDTVTFEGGTKITTLASAGDILKISHDLQTQTDSTSVASPADGATFTVVDSVTRDTTGHATGLNVKTITLPSFPTIPTVGDGQINGVTSGLGISGSMSATANQSGDTTFTVASNASIGPTVSTLMHRDTSGYGYVVTPASGDSSTKIPTTEWVNQKLTGLLEFKGGFSANTGVIANTSPAEYLTDNAARVAVEVGDYYVVTIAGDFFSNPLTPLTPGDSVIVQTAAVAGASVEGDFIVVQSDTDLATDAVVGLGNVKKSAVATLDGISVAYSAGTASVGLDIQGLTYITSTLATVDLQGIEIPIYNGEAATAANEKIEIADLVTLINDKYNDRGTIAIGDLAGTVTHNMGTKNTIVQTIDQNGDTVFCDITRTTSTVTATISVAQTAATGGIITILVQKIG